jgi:RNA polymerase sigma-70 factor (ECF subfamily)
METEIELLNLARRLNKEALIQIFDLYSVPLYRYVLRLCQDPVIADQVVGDAFAKLLDHFSSGNGPRANLRSYLYEIAYHQVIDETRFSNRNASLEATESLKSDANASFISLEEQILFKQVMLAVQNDLTQDQRHVIMLRFLEGFSLKETALVLGKKVGHVKVIQNRAIAALRKALDHKKSRIAMLPVARDKSVETLRV